MKSFVLAGLVLLALARGALAEVTRVEITRRADLGASGYEKIEGTLHFAVDPRDPRNALIADIAKAPTDAKGRVEFSSDLCVLRPKVAGAGNGTALIEVSNRGGRGLVSSFNRGGKGNPETEADLGDQFLMKQGFTLVWVGWEFDVPRGPGRIRIELPRATEAGKDIGGIAHEVFVLDRNVSEHPVAGLAVYPPSDPDGPERKLTVRTAMADAQGLEIPRARWRLKGQTITLDGGFEPGKAYEIFYAAKNPPVAGLGFAAMRDATAWLKHAPDSVAPVRFAQAFGSSQSGRFLRDFIYQGFNTDERGRKVFDGVMAHIAGAAHINLNRRWSLPTELGIYSATSYPFADAALADPASGLREGLQENARGGNAPKVFYTNTSVEYWGGGRVAALTHTTPAGEADVALPENVRSYFIAGTQHGPGRFPPLPPTAAQQRANPADYWWVMRSLVVAMQRWISEGTLPPASAVPTWREKTLVSAANLAWPAMPGVASPRALTAGARVANPLVTGGAGAGAPLPLLVAQVDEDGNERAGVRLPEIAVPLATYTGWNFRQPAVGAPGDLVALQGSWIPLAATKTEKEASKDPRRSVEERYASRDAYLAKFTATADSLVKQGYLLAGDVAPLVKRAGEQWDLVTVRATGERGAAKK